VTNSNSTYSERCFELLEDSSRRSAGSWVLQILSHLDETYEETFKLGRGRNWLIISFGSLHACPPVPDIGNLIPTSVSGRAPKKKKV